MHNSSFNLKIFLNVTAVYRIRMRHLALDVFVPNALLFVVELFLFRFFVFCDNMFYVSSVKKVC